MADRTQPLGFAGWAGIAVTAAIPVLIGATGLAVVLSAEGGRGLSASDWAAIHFTIWQAILSALLSVGLAIPVARALARRRFWGRETLITMLGAPFLLPVIVAVFGLLAIFGRGGILNAGLVALGAEPISIFGLQGVVLAHVFLNLPLATRLLLQGWHTIPSERFRLAASLNMGPGAIFRHLEIPMLVRAVPPAALIIFVMCTTSFAVALTLGGGPRATTVELAIYQAVRFDFDLTRAAMLSVVQLVITGTLALMALKWAATPGFGKGFDRPPERWDGRDWLRVFLDVTLIAAAAAFLIAPMAAVFVRGLGGIAALPDAVWMSAAWSLVVATVSTSIVLSAALVIALASARFRSGARWIESTALLAIAASPLVVGTGLFIIVFPFVEPSRLALPVTALVNALVTLPFVLRVLIPAVRDAETAYGPLADSLGLTGFARLRVLILPRIRRPLGFSAGLAAALSMGDLGVVALFADPETATLPLQLYRLMGAYRMDEAAGASLLLLGLSFLLFWACDLGGRLGA
ncbi:MAG: thiamine/thiamine pyrophosphate ABC transporter permease ThiP [Boseongicola sp.]|nr:thiamine/thiamine pyrophosphate ABC transporter permease ThiP [Boseongicola sp.]